MRSSPCGLPNPNCVVKVGDGRGFVIEQSVEPPPLPKKLKRQGLSQAKYISRRLIVTAAHCLPKIPRPPGAFGAAYQNLLGTLAAEAKPNVWAECLFVDPIADVCVLGAPDAEQFENEVDANAYDELVENATVLRTGEARKGDGFVLSLDGKWIPTRVELVGSWFGSALEIDPTMPGQSGSPVLNRFGRAIGVVSIGTERASEGIRSNERAGPQPILTRTLPSWLFCEQRGANRGGVWKLP